MKKVNKLKNQIKKANKWIKSELKSGKSLEAIFRKEENNKNVIFLRNFLINSIKAKKSNIQIINSFASFGVNAKIAKDIIKYSKIPLWIQDAYLLNKLKLEPFKRLLEYLILDVEVSGHPFNPYKFSKITSYKKPEQVRAIIRFLTNYVNAIIKRSISFSELKNVLFETGMNEDKIDYFINDILKKDNLAVLKELREDYVIERFEILNNKMKIIDRKLDRLLSLSSTKPPLKTK